MNQPPRANGSDGREAAGPSPRPAERAGMLLRALRRRAELEQPELADLLHISQSKVSRMERGLHRLDRDSVENWFTHTNATTQERNEILALLEESVVEVKGYRSVLKGGLYSGHQAVLTQDLAASRVRHFQPFRIPAPLQDAVYARAVLTANATAAETAIEEAVAARIARGERFAASDGPAYHVVMHELALRWRPAPMSETQRRDAWQRVVDLAKAPSITVQVLTAETPTSRLPNCAFMITDFRDAKEPSLAQVELPSVEISFRDTADLEAFDRDWNAVTSAALSPTDSLKFLRDIARSGPSRSS